MNRPTKLDPETARRLFLAAQLLDDADHEPFEVLRRHGYLQLDTINVVGRAQHLTLRSRKRDYSPDELDELLAARRVFEYHGRAAGYLPIEDYRFYLPAMAAFPWDGWWRRQHAELEPVIAGVRERITAEGALSSRDFKSPKAQSSGGWGAWKPAKYALAHLWLSGELMVARRDGFERVFDLTERVLPPDVDTRPPDDKELGRFLVRRALGALGPATRHDVARHLAVYRSRPLPLDEMLDTGEIAAVEITSGKTGETHYIEPKLLESAPPPPAKRLRPLNPFDGLVINRKRLKRLYGFDYTLECYKKARDRRYGYYTLPLLRGGGFVGRLDAKAHRKEKRLELRGLWWEPETRPDAALLAELDIELRSLAEFNGCEVVDYAGIDPAGGC